MLLKYDIQNEYLNLGELEMKRSMQYTAKLLYFVLNSHLKLYQHQITFEFGVRQRV